MISHEHKCIFIHISKCAGTSIEFAFGVDVENYNADENNDLFGWDNENKLWLQHATPQQLIDLNYISKDIWDTYYKFIVYRNSWDKVYSDYVWARNVKHVKDSFSNFINKKGAFDTIMNDRSTKRYAGDHLYPQKDYFFLNGKRINYDTVMDFENLQEGLNKVVQDLGLSDDFFEAHKNQSRASRKIHYSKFYNVKKKRLVSRTYREDIDFFNFKFVDQKNLFKTIKVEISPIKRFIYKAKSKLKKQF